MPRLMKPRRALDAALPPASASSKNASFAREGNKLGSSSSASHRRSRVCYFLLLGIGALMCVMVLANVMFVGRMISSSTSTAHQSGADSNPAAATATGSNDNNSRGKAAAAAAAAGEGAGGGGGGGKDDEFAERLAAMKSKKGLQPNNGRDSGSGSTNRKKGATDEDLDARRDQLMKLAAAHRAQGGDVSDPELLQKLMQREVLRSPEAGKKKKQRGPKLSKEGEEQLIEEMLLAHGDPSHKAAVMKRLAALRAGVGLKSGHGDSDSNNPAKPRSQWSEAEVAEAIKHDTLRFGSERAREMDKERQRLERGHQGDLMDTARAEKEALRRSRDGEAQAERAVQLAKKAFAEASGDDGAQQQQQQQRHIDVVARAAPRPKDDPYFDDLRPTLAVPPVSGGFVPTARPMDAASVAARLEKRQRMQAERLGGRREPEFVPEGEAPLDATKVRGVLSFAGVQVCTQRVTLKGATEESVSLHTCNGDDRDDVWEHTQGSTLRFVAEDKCLVVGPLSDPGLHYRACSDTASTPADTWGPDAANWLRLVESTKYRDSAQFQSVAHPELCLTRVKTRSLTLSPCARVISQFSPEFQASRTYWGQPFDEFHFQRVKFFPDGKAAGRSGGAQKTYDFNEVMSADIGYRRNHEHLPDQSCRDHNYGVDSLLPTSVIICFVNEEWYALLRTVHAVVDASPPQLLKEIILVDDGSDAWWIGEELEHYVATELPAGLVRIVRTGSREGLIKARLAGARAASAPILTFLDSHVEVNDNWLPPLLRPITDDHTRVTCPVITVINQKTIQQQGSFDSRNIPFGSFDWKLTFKWLYSRDALQPLVKPQWDGTATNNVFSSTMAGGLFSMHREFFWDLGSYDADMRGWGGENLEMSFRIWMCGGSIEIVPCSLVGHIFRQHNPSPFKENVVSILRHNLQRAAASLMDDFQYTYFKWSHADIPPSEDVSLRLKLREYHQCHDFAWYVENAAPGMVAPNHDTMVFIGSLRSLSGDKSRCLSMASSSAKPGSPVSLNPCWTEAAAASGNNNRRSATAGHDEQRFIATRDGRIAGSAFPSTTVCVSIGNELPRASQQRIGSRKAGYKAVVVAMAKCQPKEDSSHRFRWMALPNAVPEDHGIESTGGTGRLHHTQTLGLLVAKHSEDDEDKNPLALSSATCLGHDGRANSFLLGPCDVADEDMLWAKVQSVGDISEQSIPSREEYTQSQLARADTSREAAAAPPHHKKKLPAAFARASEVRAKAKAESQADHIREVERRILEKDASAAKAYAAKVEAAQGSHHSMAGAQGRDAAKAEFEAAIRKSKAARVGDAHSFVAQQQQQRGANAVAAVPEYRGARMHGVVGVDSRGRRLFEPTPVPNNQEQRKAIQHHGFNATLSESLPLDREILDKRAPACRADLRNYPADLSGLPDTTVIFVFVNEEKSVLLRSIHSVLNRSPPHLLKEIILVDDGSDEDYITGGVDVPGSLEEYLAYALPDKVRLIRQGSRTGLIEARLSGMRAATSQTVTVLDSHIEVQDGWLEPLMARIAGDRTRVVMPVIDGLSANDLQPSAGGIQVLGILWGMTEHGIPLQQIHRAAPGFNMQTDPQASPFMAGGLFSVDRKFMLEDLEGYDTGIKYWGAENLEFSLRTWQCGGSIEMMPCSRVYHIFRTLGGKPYKVPGSAVTHNKLRVVLGWMDEANQPWALNQVVGDDRTHALDDVGDFSTVRAVQDKLHCKDFSWFLENVYPENAVSDCRGSSRFGQLYLAEANQCLRVHRWGAVAADFVECKTPRAQGTPLKDIAIRAPVETLDQRLFLTESGYIRVGSEIEKCLYVDRGSFRLQVSDCDRIGQRDRRWTWDRSTRQMRHSATAKCLGAVMGKPVAEKCEDGATRQQWEWRPL